MILEDEFTARMLPWLEAGRWIVGFSGGGDSLALLELCRRMPLHPPLLAAHLHHGLRGEEADAEEAFCREYCRRHGIEFVRRRVDVRARARQRGENLEEAARRERRAFFTALARDYATDGTAGKEAVLLLAHHQDDQVETILMRLLRGAGWRGLEGIRAEGMIPMSSPSASDGRCGAGAAGLRIFRPLLAFRRDTLVKFLDEAALRGCEDSSNREISYTRNRVRLEVLPRLERELPYCRQRLLDAATLAGKVEHYILECARRIVHNREWGGLFLSARDGEEVAECGWLRAAELAVMALLPEVKELRLRGESLRTLRFLMRQLRAGAATECGACLCHDIRVRIEGEGLFFFNPSAREQWLGRSGERLLASSLADLRGEGFFYETANFRVCGRLTSSAGAEAATTVSNVVFLAVERLRFPLVMRRPQRGERMRGSGGGLAKEVKAIASERKIPLRQREGMQVVADQEGILWLPPLLMSGRAVWGGLAGEVLRIEFSPK